MIANTQEAPTAARSTPPTAGPIVMPMFRPIATRLFAQATFSCGTRFGIAALEAGQNGASAIAERNAAATSGPGESMNAIAKKHAALAPSETIITRRRSKRSPSTAASGPTTPLTPSVRMSAAASQAADPVRS